VEGRRLVVVLGATLALGVLAIVRTVGPAFYYRLRWVWVPPAIGFALVAWAAWLVVTRRWPGSARALTYGALAALAVVSAVNAYTAATSGTPLAGDSEVVVAITGPVLDRLDAEAPDGGEGGVVLVSDVMHNGAWYARSLVLELERRGVEVRVPPEREPLFGPHRVLDGEPVRADLVVAFDQVAEHLRTEPGYELVAEWSSVTRAESRAFLDLYRRFEAGELEATEYLYAFEELDLYDRHPATYFAVSVFERTPVPAVGG
jgi:hypothetical protein